MIAGPKIHLNSKYCCGLIILLSDLMNLNPISPNTKNCIWITGTDNKRSLIQAPRKRILIKLLVNSIDPNLTAALYFGAV